MAASAGLAARHDHLMRAASLAGQCFAGAPEDAGLRTSRAFAGAAWAAIGLCVALTAGGALLFLA